MESECVIESDLWSVVMVVSACEVSALAEEVVEGSVCHCDVDESDLECAVWIECESVKSYDSLCKYCALAVGSYVCVVESVCEWDETVVVD